MLGKLIRKPVSWAFLAIGFLVPLQAHAGLDLIRNGGFEADGVATSAPQFWIGFSDGGFTSGATGANALANGDATAGAANGGYYGLIDGSAYYGNGGFIQGFSTQGVGSAVLGFRMFVNNSYAGTSIDSSGLDFTTGGAFNPNQYLRVDLLADGAPALDTGAGVLRSFYLGGATGTDVSNPYVDFSFDLTTDLAQGGSYQLRFAGVGNQGPLSIGVDDVSLVVTQLPEPWTCALLLVGLGALGTIRRAGQHAIEARRRSDARGSGSHKAHSGQASDQPERRFMRLPKIESLVTPSVAQ